MEHDLTKHPVDCPACQGGASTYDHYRAGPMGERDAGDDH
jgi:hypothetical protein